MSYSNYRRGNGNRTDAYPSVGGGDTSPSNIVIMTNDDRIAVLSIYTTSRGVRTGTVTLAIKKKAPDILDDVEKDSLIFGQQEARETLPVLEALALAKSWLAGHAAVGEVL